MRKNKAVPTVAATVITATLIALFLPIVAQARPLGPVPFASLKARHHLLLPKKAHVLPNGKASIPLGAPPEVQAIIRAGNKIAKKPYVWGGGHGSFSASGYDCSGSVSFALKAADKVQTPMVSGAFASWGKPGEGKWLTVYANGGHVFMVVAGVRFDTVGLKVNGTRWQSSRVSTAGYIARHI